MNIFRTMTDRQLLSIIPNQHIDNVGPRTVLALESVVPDKNGHFQETSIHLSSEQVKLLADFLYANPAGH